MSALDVLASLVLEDGACWGERAAGFQWADAEAILDETSATPYSFLTRGRGGSKTSDLAGMLVAVALEQAPPGARLYSAAADRDQGRLLVDAIEGFRQRTQHLAGAVEVQAYRVVFPGRDVVLEVLAADAPGAWGLRPYFLTIDEVAQWPSTSGPRLLFEALSTSVAKSPSCRLALLTSAGDPAHWSRRVREHALADPLWRVHEVPGPVPWLDASRVEEQRRRLPDSSFRRLFLNEWVAAEDRLVDEDDLAACVLLDGPQEPIVGRRYVIGLDVGLRRDATAAAVCSLDAEKRVRLDRLEVWEPTKGREVELSVVQAWVEETARIYHGAVLVYDPYQAVQLAQAVRRAGVRAVEFTFTASSVGRLAVTLHQLLRDRRLVLPDDPGLLEELRNVRLRETSPGVLRLDHDPDKHDDRAVALGLAALELAARPVGSVESVRYRDASARERAAERVQRGELVFHGAHYRDREERR